MTALRKPLNHQGLQGVNKGGSDLWRTPDHLFKLLDEEFKFSHDIAASAENAKCAEYFSDAFSEDWSQVESGFCNPPYSMVQQFLELAHQPESCVFLIPARTQATYFQKLVYCNTYCHEIRYLHRGVVFDAGEDVEVYHKGVRAPFPLCIVIFRNVERIGELRQTLYCADTLICLHVINKGHNAKGRELKFDLDQYDQLLKLRRRGETLKRISEISGVPISTVGRIVKRLPTNASDL